VLGLHVATARVRLRAGSVVLALACAAGLVLSPGGATAQGARPGEDAAGSPAAGETQAGAAGTAPAAAAGELPQLVVFPFRVHSGKPIEYLGESLANLLRTRLQASGRVDVLDPDRVDEELGEAQLRETRDSELRHLAEELGAGYVVTGSVTELAGHYSLDVRVTPATPGLEGHTLVLTADQEDQLLGRVNEVAEDVIEHVVGAAPARVVQVSLEGAGSLTQELLPRLAIRTGEPFDPTAIRDDLAMLRAQPGVARAAVETARSPEGIAILYRVVRGGPGGPSAPSAAQTVLEVQVRGNRRIDTAAIEARIATKPGQPLRRAQIARDLRQINELGFFRNVRVFIEPTDRGQIVIFDVEENPVVRQISISGNENVDGDAIRDILTLTTGSTLDYPLLFENRERIAALYRAEGYYLAEVTYEVEPLSEHSVGIQFVVEENKKLKLRKITFKGNEHFTNKELLAGFHTKTWHWWSYATKWFDRSGTYSEPLFLQDLQGVQKLYADAGYLQVEVGEPDVIPSPEGLEVSVHITEGRRFKVGTIEISGDESLDTESLEQKLLLKEGDWFNRSYLADSVKTLTEHYADRGFYFANVTPVSNLSDATESVDVDFEVRKGPLYFIREVDISGNTVTVDPVIRREVQLVEGQLYSQREVLLSRLRIDRLGYFEEVDVQMEPTEVPEQLDMAVRVVEKPTGSFSFGAGFSSQDGFVATGSLSQANLFGRGYAASASVDFGGSTQRFYLSLTDPYFLGSEFSLGVTAFLTNVEFESFSQNQLGVSALLGHALSEDKRKQGFLRYEYARRKLDDESRYTAASLIFRELIAGTLDSSMLGLTVSADTRNDRLAPTKGWNLGFSLDGAGLLGFAQFLRAEGRAVWYMGAPSWMPERSTFVVGTRVGYALPFNSIGDYDLPNPVLPPGDYTSENPDFPQSIAPLGNIDTDLTLPLSERYFLGGLGQFQLRGFRARSVGPRRPILIQATDQTGVIVDPDLYIPFGSVVENVDPTDPDVVLPPGDQDAILGAICTFDGTVPGTPGSQCNGLEKINDLSQTDVIGGNKFISASFEYRFPISDLLGLQGLVFFDTGNAFAEGENLFDVTDWRYGTGVGVQWFSPFGPLAVVMGFPLDKLSFEDSPVFEFSVGGRDF
jgi:outer membrane protein insertion porin family